MQQYTLDGIDMGQYGPPGMPPGNQGANVSGNVSMQGSLGGPGVIYQGDEEPLDGESQSLLDVLQGAPPTRSALNTNGSHTHAYPKMTSTNTSTPPGWMNDKYSYLRIYGTNAERMGYQASGI